MLKMSEKLLITSLCLFLAGATVAANGKKEIPLIHEVDVVVVGGTGGAVAAACKAANFGAKVFLVAPRPYLGDDIAGSMRFWDSGKELPKGKMAKELFGEKHKVIPFKYTISDLQGKKVDETSGNELNDGIWNNPTFHGLECKGNGRKINLDLGKSLSLKKVKLYTFKHPRAPNNRLTSIILKASSDGRTWTDVGKYLNHPPRNPPKDGDQPDTRVFEFPLDCKARYLQLISNPNRALGIQILAEIVVEADGATPEYRRRGEFTSPLNIKKFFDDALLKAGVGFMTGCYGTEILVDSNGDVSGVVITNRSGRQAIKAKVVVDATPRGILVRHAGAKFAAFKPGTYTFSKVVLSGKAPKAANMRVREFPKTYNVKIGGRWGVRPANGSPIETTVKMYECKIPIKMQSDSPFSFAEAEQEIRDKTFTSDQQDIAEFSFFVPPDYMRGQSSSKKWNGADEISLGVFQPKGLKYIYVLSGMASVSRKVAAELLEPANLMNVGERLGAATAVTAKKRNKPGEVTVRTSGKKSSNKPGEIRELLDGLLPNSTTASGKVVQKNSDLPVLGRCDVLVAGGGTSGGPAAIAAARQGMKTIVCEYHYDLGGVSTVGVLGKYYYGNHCGFTKEIDTPIKQIAANINQGKAEWFRRECRKLKIKILLGTIVCGALVKDNKITGVVVVAPDGTRGIIEAKAVIDATGNADVAAAAGVETEFITAQELSLQGATMNKRQLGENTENIDIGFVDDTDAWDMSFFPLRTRETLKYNMFWDQSQHVCSRERRHIVGKYTIMPVDVLNHRTFPDTITQCSAPFDTHGQTTHRLLYLYNSSVHGRQLKANIPYTAILPKKLDGLLVVGLGMSAHRDALPVIRMQRDMHNLGYAAGCAAALAVKDKSSLQHLDVKKLQRQLVDVKILKPEVLGFKDNFPLPEKELLSAIKELPKLSWKNLHGFSGLQKLYTNPAKAKSLLLKAYNSTEDSHAKTMYAAALALFGDNSGAKTLIKAVKRSPKWDKGWNWKGMGAYGRKFSYLDGYIIMLAEIKSKKALPVILEKAKQLNSKSEYSHFRGDSPNLVKIPITNQSTLESIAYS